MPKTPTGTKRPADLICNGRPARLEAKLEKVAKVKPTARRGR